MEFILLMDRINCWYNTPLQVLTEAPALHLLIVHGRKDVAAILEILFHKHCDLNKLILKDCFLGEDGTGLLANIVVLYPDLEVLSLEGSRPLTHAGYCLIPRLKNLSELNLSHCKVDYVYVKLRESHVCIREVCRTPIAIHFIYLGKKEIYCRFKSCCIISVLFSTKWDLFLDFIIFYSSNIFFINYVLKFRYPPS